MSIERIYVLVPLLVPAYLRPLRLAEQYKINSLAFPAIFTGAFGYPMEIAAEVAFRTIKEMLPELNSVRLIRFVVFSQVALYSTQNMLTLLNFVY